MPRGESKEDIIDIDEFLNEMVSLIEKRMKKQEESIREMESEIKKMKASMSGLSKSGEVKIDKSVLKVLKQL